MTSKKTALKKSEVTVNEGETKDNKKYVVFTERGSCSKILTGKASASREAQKWLRDNYYGNSPHFIAEVVGRVQKRQDPINDVPVIEV